MATDQAVRLKETSLRGFAMPELLTTSEVAERLRLSTSSVRTLCDTKRLRCFRPMGRGGHRRIYADSVDAFLSSGAPDEHVELTVPKDVCEEDPMAELERLDREVSQMASRARRNSLK